MMDVGTERTEREQGFVFRKLEDSTRNVLHRNNVENVPMFICVAFERDD